MSTHNVKGRAWATHADVKEGTVVEADSDFGCIKRGNQKTVKLSDKGRFFIDCAFGEHYLDGCCDYRDGDPVYIGLYNVTKEQYEKAKYRAERPLPGPFDAGG